MPTDDDRVIEAARALAARLIDARRTHDRDRYREALQQWSLPPAVRALIYELAVAASASAPAERASAPKARRKRGSGPARRAARDLRPTEGGALHDPLTDFQRRCHARAVAMFTAARVGDDYTFNVLGQEAADEHSFSALVWSFAGLLDTAVLSLANVTGRPVEELLAAMGLAIAQDGGTDG